MPLLRELDEEETRILIHKLSNRTARDIRDKSEILD
jgi:hypothetical protein